MRTYLLPDWLVEFGLANLPAVYAVGFLGFFALVAVGLAVDRRPAVRTGVVVCLVCTLLFFNVFTPYILPFVDFHKFSEAPDETRSYYELRVTTATDDRELHYDSKAIPPKLHTHLDSLGEEIVTNMTDRDREATSRYLLERANVYRQTLPGRPSLSDVLDFPYHANEDHWRPADLPDGDFAVLRIYRITIESNAAGTAVTNATETQVYTYESG